MSNVKPMTAGRRAENYRSQGGLSVLTPAQSRRTRKKDNRRLRDED